MTGLTEIEKLKMENFALRQNLMQQQFAALMAERTVYIGQIEANHPGYRWDDAKGVLAELPPAATSQQK